MLISLCGWIGSLAYALFALPQTMSVIGKRRCDLPMYFIGLVLLGSVFSFIYILPQKDMPLMFNFGLNIVLFCILLCYKIRSKGS